MSGAHATPQVTRRKRFGAAWQRIPPPVRGRITRSLIFAGVGLGMVFGAGIVASGWLAFGVAITGWPLVMNSVVNVALLRTTAGVQPDDGERAKRLLTELCDELGVKQPRLTVLNTKTMKNAAALQLLRRDVLITVPLLRSMNDHEVKAVLTHEMGHLRHHDSQLNLGTYWGSQSAWYFLNRGGVAKVAAIVGSAVAAPLAYLSGPLAITAMLGMGYWRERQADVYTASKTPYGPELSNALRSLGGGSAQRPTTALRRVKVRALALYSISPHPPVWDRVALIDRLSAERQAKLARASVTATAALPATSAGPALRSDLGLSI